MRTALFFFDTALACEYARWLCKVPDDPPSTWSTGGPQA